MARKKVKEIEEVEEIKEEIKEEKLIKCKVLSQNFGKYVTGDILELAKEIYYRYEKLGYLGRI